MKLLNINGWILLAVGVAFSTATHAESGMLPMPIDGGGTATAINSDVATPVQKEIDPALVFDESVEILQELSGIKVVVVRANGDPFIGSLQVKDKSIEITTQSPVRFNVEFLVYVGGDAWWWGLKSENEKTEAIRHFDELMTPERIKSLQDHVNGQLWSKPFVLLRAPAPTSKSTARPYMVDMTGGEYTLVLQ